MTKNSVLSNFVNIYVSPLDVFRQLKEQPNFLFPLLLLIICSTVVMIWYYASVDFNWLMDYFISIEADGHSEEEKQQIVSSLSAMTPIMMGAITIISSLVMIIAHYTVLSLYFVVISLFTNDGFRFKYWFCLVNWAFLPTLLAFFAIFVTIALNSNGQIGPNQLNSLTLNNLFFHLPNTHHFKTILDSIDISFLWSIVLLILGYQVWTKKSIVNSGFIVLTPYLLVYGIWLLIILV